ncbi:unnamed protein product [Leptosia nina]|uniref:Uncharacterized protein n=1 Tax=Leptosia nina TaxID=320188 RepID=A0AAV1K039_9NEOP
MLNDSAASVLDSFETGVHVDYEREFRVYFTNRMQFDVAGVFAVPRHQITIVRRLLYGGAIRPIADYEVLVPAPVFNHSVHGSQTYFSVLLLSAEYAIRDRPEQAVAVAPYRYDSRHRYLDYSLCICNITSVVNILTVIRQPFALFEFVHTKFLGYRAF